ncbi:MAG: hypothetical protein R3B09_00965 [Nannocystaceae bacterium]
MAYLRDCPSCACLVRPADSTCPFCGVSLRSAVAPSWLALGLALGLAGATVGCEEKDDDTMTEGTSGDMSTGEMTTGDMTTTSDATMTSTDSEGTGATTTTTTSTSDTTATTTTTSSTTDNSSASASGSTYAGPDEVDTIDDYAEH